MKNLREYKVPLQRYMAMMDLQVRYFLIRTISKSFEITYEKYLS